MKIYCYSVNETSGVLSPTNHHTRIIL